MGSPEPPVPLPANVRSPEPELRRAAAQVVSAPFVSAVLEAFPGPAFVLDPNRQIVGANSEALRAFGARSLDDALGLRPGEIARCRVAAGAPGGCGTREDCRYCGALRTVVASLTSGGQSKGECLIATVGGDTLNLEVASNCIEVEGRPLVLVGLRDISAEKHREFLQGAFLHDLMNTAGGLQGLLEMTKDERGPADPLLPVLEELVRSLVDEIEGQRHLMKAEQGHLQTDWQKVDLDRALELVTTLCRAHPVAKGRRIELRAETGAQVVTDPTLLRRVVGNLIKNALEATPEGEAVDVVAEIATTGARVSVGNPGAIPEAARAHIFKRGFSTKGMGRGTGTHAVRVLTERYLGGSVGFETDETRGTRFTLQIPPAPPGWSEPVEASASPEGSIRFDGVRVLVADDDAIQRRVARHRLERLGAKVWVVETGEAALELVAAQSFDLVLLDVEMPGAGGLAAARALMQLPSSRRPVVAMASGHDEPPAEEADFDVWLGKPCRERELRELRRRLNPRRARSASSRGSRGGGGHADETAD